MKSFSPMPLLLALACRSTGAQGTSSGATSGNTSSGSQSSSTTVSSSASSGAGGGSSSKRGFPEGSPWVSFYGPAAGVDLAKVAATFRVINIEADPSSANFTDAQIQTLRAGGKNRVISYMNVGACESYRSYWDKKPPGFESCVSSGALTTDYDGYPDEKWANLANVAYRKLIVDYVAPRLAERGIDGFFLDNLEVIEHGKSTNNGPCDAACAQGGLDLVWELRQKFPEMLIVMQNASGEFARLGKSHGQSYPTLLDGVSHEEVYTDPDPNKTARAEMLAWVAMGLQVNGRPFWLASEDYVGACSAANKSTAESIYAQAKTDALNAYVTDASGKQLAPCFWDAL
jgi:cysteinyl-tRNA synthetase